MINALCILFFCGALTASATDAPESQNPAANPGDNTSLSEKLSWKHDELSLSFRGWIFTDIMAMPRTERDADKADLHISPELRSARLIAFIGFSPEISTRLTFEMAGSNFDIHEIWADYAPMEIFRIRAGRIRVPFGMTQQTGLGMRTLNESPIIANNSRDYYDHGIMVSGDLGGRILHYALSMVSGTRTGTIDVNDSPDIAGRFMLRPFAGTESSARFLHMGASGTYGEGPVRNGFRVRTPGNHTVSPPPNIRGLQERLGAEISFRHPKFRLDGEYQWLRQHRSGLNANQATDQGVVKVERLNPYIVQGWYIESAFLLFGESGPNIPVKGLEIAGRFESLDFGDGTETSTLNNGAVITHSPLIDSTVETVSAALNLYMSNGMRLSTTWQIIRYGQNQLAPNYEPNSGSPEALSNWVNHFSLRMGFSIL